MTRGGSRPGAGRKPGATQYHALLIRIPLPLWDMLVGKAEGWKVSVNALIVAVLRDFLTAK